MRAFIADDSVMVRERLREMLFDMPGVDVIGEAGDGREAVRAVRELHPDVVILDVRMPEGNGIEALEAIKKENPALIVIMLTNYPYPQYRRKCEELGADFFFDKSTEFEKAIEVIQKIAGANHS